MSDITLSFVCVIRRLSFKSKSGLIEFYLSMVLVYIHGGWKNSSSSSVTNATSLGGAANSEIFFSRWVDFLSAVYETMIDSCMSASSGFYVLPNCGKASSSLASFEVRCENSDILFELKSIEDYSLIRLVTLMCIFLSLILIVSSLSVLWITFLISRSRKYSNSHYFSLSFDSLNS